MSKVILVFIIEFLALTTLLNAQTQSEMTGSASKRLQNKEWKMNKTLTAISVVYKDKKEFLKKLKISQGLWLKFREAHLAAIYPAKDKQLAYGSVFPMCYAMEKGKLTAVRIKQLNFWLTGVEEGVVGRGSIKFKTDLKDSGN